MRAWRGETPCGPSPKRRTVSEWKKRLRKPVRKQRKRVVVIATDVMMIKRDGALMQRTPHPGPAEAELGAAVIGAAELGAAEPGSDRST